MRIMRTLTMAGLGWGAYKAYKSYRAQTPPRPRTMGRSGML